MSEKKTYLTVLAKAFSSANAWRATAFANAVIAAILAAGLVYSSTRSEVVLVPYELAAAPKSQGVRVELSSRDFGVDNPEYLTQVALGDLALILNWFPENVVAQHARFLNRLTPQLYEQLNVKLRAEAEEFKSASTTQSFFPKANVKASSDNTVRVEGTLVRTVGEKEALRTNVAYKISYEKHRGYLHVKSMEIER